MVQVGPTEKRLFEQKFIGSEGVGHVAIWEKIILAKGMASGNGLKVGPCQG